MNASERPARIILVEDDVQVAPTAQRLLSARRGVVVELCCDVGSARRALGRPFDMIISDYELPDGDGIEVLTAAARADASAPRVLVTGRTDWDCATSAINRGEVFRILAKPVEAHALARTLDDALAARHQAEAEARRAASGHLIRALSCAVDRRLSGSVPTSAIARLGRALAERLRLGPAAVETVELTCLSHRIGAIGLCDDASAALIPLVGADILGAAGFPAEIARAVAESGEQFVHADWPSTSLPSRILAFCARYLELTEREGASHEAACSILLRDESLDPLLVASFAVEPEPAWDLAASTTVPCPPPDAMERLPLDGPRQLSLLSGDSARRSTSRTT